MPVLLGRADVPQEERRQPRVPLLRVHPPPTPQCRKCGAEALVLEGLGTEKLEETLAAAFPLARVARLDRDVASGEARRGEAVERIMARMRARELDILVGTQMVTKGHDLPHVTLVGVINADAALSSPTSARGAGVPAARAGGRSRRPRRGGAAGAGARADVRPGAAGHRLRVAARRRRLPRPRAPEPRGARLPPLSRIALVRVEAVLEEDARSAATHLAEVARSAASPQVEVLGPAPAPLARLRNRFRYRVMLRGKDRRFSPRHARDPRGRPRRAAVEGARALRHRPDAAALT